MMTVHVRYDDNTPFERAQEIADSVVAVTNNAIPVYVVPVDEV